ncbi:leucyl aminopeptidase family protein [Lysobacter sp. GX 14042]|uniref:leucyl aminopeptidase family protein n=1 Tax=Lysobacter sp. GX 14042 TaxID=2907155 RepID=UPI0031BA3534
MTDPALLPGLVPGGDGLPLHLVGAAQLEDWLSRQPDGIGAWVRGHGFQARPHTALVLPGSDGAPAGAVLGIGDPHDPASYGHAAHALPAACFRLAGTHDPVTVAALQLGWGLGAYRFARYRKPAREPARLVLDGDSRAAQLALAACLRVRDLVNTPTEDMGPEQLEEIARQMAERAGATLEVTTGGALLERNFPAIHAVGRASHRAPRLIHLQWGDPAHPLVAIVGKGVCFDTGGLDLKPAAGMRNMKKDMGGAAHALALAEWIMAAGLPLRIDVLVPAVENAIGPESFRPGEVIATRAGISVEIDNTDAEGRLVLCDALAFAAERKPALLLDFATLTGAARIALGPDLPALYSNDDAVAQAWLEAGTAGRDPVWRMPLWRPYWRYLTSHVADIANGGPSKMGGSITAALYLERFVPEGQAWAHLDTFAWNEGDSPGRPVGGEAQGLRSAFAMLGRLFAG